MSPVTIDTLLDDFVAYSDEIQGVVMVSKQGQPLTHSIGFSDESTRILTENILYLVSCLAEHCQWNTIDWVTIRAEEGYFLFSQVRPDAFLLFKVTAVSTNYLQNHILQFLEKLQTALQFSNPNITVLQQSYRPIEFINSLALSSTTITPGKSSLDSSTYLQQSTSPIPVHLGDLEITNCLNALTEKIGPIASMICERIIEQNPDLRLTEFINILSKHIPDQQEALEFQKRLFSNKI